ncbi:hypothetical protein CAPTEDRAFT_158355 [Capitella teleta]|uniref:Globin domain-containing protein n=1 Tax=Capitella teleta TaxID=283909 RepID=R7THB5_CAPTE|nr:hypothetical protein CAPTEDRAFT_158355 [Capitella teleta]|eukprot:ELT92822.1 hypothetical protein CAPTEDRAFT_158355 [Capitella teleta]
MVSAAEVSAIQGHWNANVKPNMQAVANLLFVKYFTANPADQALFKSFAGVPIGDLSSNAAFSAQTLAVLSYVDKVVDGLGSNAVQLMKDQVEPHKARNISVDTINKMFVFLPGFIGENGGNAACVAAWKAAGAELYGAMK